MCTRSIINVGLRNVFYIEPYPKSAAKDLYSDSIVVDRKLSRGEYLDRIAADNAYDKRVHFIAFEGVAPRRYIDLFRYAGARKHEKTGRAQIFDPTEATPRYRPAYSPYLLAEKSDEEEVGRIISVASYEAASGVP